MGGGCVCHLLHTVPRNGAWAWCKTVGVGGVLRWLSGLETGINSVSVIGLCEVRPGLCAVGGLPASVF